MARADFSPSQLDWLSDYYVITNPRLIALIAQYVDETIICIY